MIPRHHSLVPQNPERWAALEAILYVEQRRARDPHWKRAEYPWAQAFFRFFCGKGKICGKSLNKVTGIYWDPREKLTSLRDWEMAFDTFIASRGEYCPCPLPSDLRQTFFPEVVFRQSDRTEKRFLRKSDLALRQQHHHYRKQEERYQTKVAQAEIDLAFHTPSTLRSWYARWSREDINPHDLDRMLWQWIGRYPSLNVLEKGCWQNEPLWELEAAIYHTGGSLTLAQEAMDNWLIPNKLTVTI